MKQINHLLVAGAGMMGKNIAFVFSSNPAYDITVYDLFPTDVPGVIRKNVEDKIAVEIIANSLISGISVDCIKHEIKITAI